MSASLPGSSEPMCSSSPSAAAPSGLPCAGCHVRRERGGVIAAALAEQGRPGAFPRRDRDGCCWPHRRCPADADPCTFQLVAMGAMPLASFMLEVGQWAMAAIMAREQVDISRPGSRWTACTPISPGRAARGAPGVRADARHGRRWLSFDFAPPFRGCGYGSAGPAVRPGWRCARSLSRPCRGRGARCRRLTRGWPRQASRVAKPLRGSRRHRRRRRSETRCDDAERGNACQGARRFRRGLREEVHVVEAGDAAAQHLGAGEQRAVADEGGRDMLRLGGPDGFLQPAHQRQIVGDAAHQRHGGMRVQVDQAGDQHDVFRPG
jgi:hypothetical protein